jgi:regulator of sigma E protease
MDVMIMVAQLLLSLSFLVAVHEMGHLLAAKYFGMRVEQFSIGFPPKIWSFKKGETEYALSAIPLGGYVKISGMIDESLDTESLKQEPQEWEFRAKPAWQRLIVMLGGIFVNLVVGVLIFIGITFVYGDRLVKKDFINANGGFYAGALAERLNLKTGDQIVAINGHDYDYFEELTRAETLLSTDPSYTVVRDGKEFSIKLPVDLIQDLSKKENHYEFVSYRLPPVVHEVADKTIASDVKLQEGDRIVEIYGRPIKYYDELTELVKKSKQETISFKVERKGKVLAFENQKFKDLKNKAIGFRAKAAVDVIPDAVHVQKYGFAESVPLGAERAFTTLIVQVKAFGKVITGALSAKESISGPIGIANAFGSEWDGQRFWMLTGVLSLVLAFMNLLPIPALDGGHVMFLSYEIISRRKPSDKFLESAQKVGMVLLLTLMVFIFANDIWKLIDEKWLNR